MPRQQGMGGGAFGFVKVRVMSIGDTHALTLDDNGSQYDVPLAMRTGGAGHPRVGQTWILTKVAGKWTFTTLIDKRKAPVITAPRDGADPLTVQILDVLLYYGLVEEEGRSQGRRGGQNHG